MRVNKNGYIETNQMTLWLPQEIYHGAVHASAYLCQGIKEAIEAYLNIEITGQVYFRVIELSHHDNTVKVQIHDDWVQPTKA